MLENTEAIQLGKGGSFRLLVPGLSPEVMKSPNEEAVDNYRTGHWGVEGRPHEAGWGGKEEEIFLKKEHCKGQEIILKLFWSKLFQCWRRRGIILDRHNQMNRDRYCGEWPVGLRQNSAL